MSRTLPRLVFSVVLLLWLTLPTGGLVAQDLGPRRDPARSPKTLRVSMDWLTLSYVSRQDARIAFRVWIESLALEMGLDMTTRARIAETGDEVRRSVAAREADLIVLNALTYLGIRDTCPLEPVVMVKRSDGVGDSYLLLVRQKTPVKSLSALAGRKVLVCTAGKGAIPRLWLETRLRAAGLPRAKDHFSSIRGVLKPSRAVLPVFFGQADACVVSRQAYALITELNPQLGKELAVVETSPRFADTLVCFRRDYEDAAFRKKLVSRILRVHESTKGQTIMTIFKVERFTPFEAIHLRSLVPLLAASAAGAKPDGGKGGR